MNPQQILEEAGKNLDAALHTNFPVAEEAVLSKPIVITIEIAEEDETPEIISLAMDKFAKRIVEANKQFSLVMDIPKDYAHVGLRRHGKIPLRYIRAWFDGRFWNRFDVGLV